MKKLKFLLLVLVILITNSTFAQVAINADGDDPNSKSILDVQSTTKGMLIPRMTTLERTTLGNLSATAERGMLVYDWEQGAFYYFNGAGTWIKMAVDGSADSDWTVSGNNMYSAVSGDVGIGKTSGFNGKLDVVGKIYVDNSSGVGMQIYTAGNPGSIYGGGGLNNGLEINGAEGHGVFVGITKESGLYVQNATKNGVSIANAASGLNINNASDYGVLINNTGLDGLYISSASRNGAYINSVNNKGFSVFDVGNASNIINSTEKNGFDVAGAEGNGLYVGQADIDGVKISSVGSPSAVFSSSLNNGMEINGVQGHGVFVGIADKSGLYVNNAAEYGVFINSATIDGLNILSATRNGVFVNSVGNKGFNVLDVGSASTIHSSAEKNGFDVAGASGNGLYVGQADADGVKIYKAGTPAGVKSNSYSNGVEINGNQGNGVYVGRSDMNGIEIDSSGTNGVKIYKAGTPAGVKSNSYSNGVEINGTQGNGVYVGRSNLSGVEIDSAGTNGVRINNAGTDGLYIYKAGNTTLATTSPLNNGVEIEGAAGHGVFVGHASNDGLHVENAVQDGLEIYTAGEYGVWVYSASENGFAVAWAGDDGLHVGNADNRGVYAHTTQSSHEWGIYTPDKIYGSNLTSKSSSTYGLNTGNQSLQPGDVVCIAGGIENNIEGTENLFAINLEMANESNRNAVFGVVEYKVHIKTNVKEHKSEDNQVTRIEDKAFAYTDGDVYAGDYFSVIILGPAEVNVDSKTSIKVGDNVCIGNNGVSSQRVTEVNGISIAENVGILGKSMETASRGKMLVYVNCK